MTTKMNLNGTTRKALVAAIAEITGDQPIYRKVPTCNYDIGDITITKDGSIICPDDSDILAALVEAGFTAENDDAAEHTENTGLTVSLPSDGFTDSAIDNLRKLVDAKASLMRKALGADRLDIEVTDDRVSFPWWDTLPEPEDTRVYTGFITTLCNMSKDASGYSPRKRKSRARNTHSAASSCGSATSATTARQPGKKLKKPRAQ